MSIRMKQGRRYGFKRDPILTVSNLFKNASANLLNVQAGLLDTFDENEAGGERRERRRKDSGASEQEEEVTLRSFYRFILVTNKTVNIMCKICLLTCFKVSFSLINDLLILCCLAGWSKEDRQPVLVHRTRHSDLGQREHKHRSPGIVVILLPLNFSNF